MSNFYLGRLFDLTTGKTTDQPLQYDADDLTTHGVIVGMTGSGKTGLCLDLMEEAALNDVPAIMIDPKGDITNALLHFPELAPAAWNALISDPEMVVIDTRNDIEVELGTFANAINPETVSFTQFADFVEHHLDPNEHKKVAMFCTDGIRCEEAAAYLLQRGFENVYHLKGGILKYLEEVPADRNGRSR